MCQKAQRSTCWNKNNKNQDDRIIPNVNLLSSSPLLRFIKYQKLKIVRIRVSWTGTITAEHQVNWQINCFGASVINVDSENTPTNHWLLPLANWTYRRPQPSRYNPNVLARPWTLFSLLFSLPLMSVRSFVDGPHRQTIDSQKRQVWHHAKKFQQSAPFCLIYSRESHEQPRSGTTEGLTVDLALPLDTFITSSFRSNSPK